MMKCSNFRITELQVGPGGGCRKERKNPNCQGKRYESRQDEFFRARTLFVAMEAMVTMRGTKKMKV